MRWGHVAVTVRLHYTVDMCGFAGVVRFNEYAQVPIDMARAGAMLDAVRHRGPDDETVVQRTGCVFVHARLSIIDEPCGIQPMSQSDLTVVFNGAIYNHRELRNKLTKLGHRFGTDHSDTEVLLHGYRQWGTDLAGYLRGMFAFAIWDEGNRELFLTRDRVGQKPLFVRRGDDEFCFASVVSALANDGGGDADPQAMLTYLRFGYTFEQSLAVGIRELPAGHWLKFDAAGHCDTRAYWQMPNVSRSTHAVGNAEALSQTLFDAVDARLEADVPIGCFLSGGMDSSLIAAMTQRALQQRGQPAVRTFCASMPDANYDESEHAHAVAEHIGSQHTQLSISPGANVIDDLTTLIERIGEPTADSSLLPTYWISRAARQHVKVALSGDGGDELFGGYDRYRAMRLLAQHGQWLRQIPSWLIKPNAVNPYSMRSRAARLLHAGAVREPAEQYRRMIHLFTDAQLRELAPGLSEQLTTSLPDWPDDTSALTDDLSSKAQARSLPGAGGAAMRWDFNHYLPFDVLRKVDRASMSVGLEVRCPMLDASVVQLGCHLPAEALMVGGQLKGLLRQAAEPWLPAGILQRKKRGFAVPIGRWFCTSLKDALHDRLIGEATLHRHFERSVLRRMYDEHVNQRADHTHRLFAMLTLAIWLKWMRT